MSLDQTLRALHDAFPLDDHTLPALFVGHGSPMNAIEDSDFSRAWKDAADALPTPRAILCVSAHWETRGTQVTSMETPRTIHDFGRFPQALFDVLYPAPGSPELASLTRAVLAHEVPVALDTAWGLDHGTWSILCRMYPKAEIPVVQLSLDRREGPAFHYALGKALKELRRRGVLIVGSGNIVHNLPRMAMVEGGFDWAEGFDAAIAERIVAGDHEAIVHYERFGTMAQLSVPTNEHYLPLLYVLGLQDEGEPVRFFADQMAYGSLSMRSVRVG